MSVTPKTHQSAMAPYNLKAASAFELYSVAAVFRSALLVKVWPVQAGGDSSGGEGEGSGSEGEGGAGEGESKFGHTANLSWRKRTVSLPPASVFPWFVRVRTSRYLLGRVGVHSVVVPSSGNVGVPPLCQVLWLSVATGVHGPKFSSPV